jgi:hypothetical protein
MAAAVLPLTACGGGASTEPNSEPTGQLSVNIVDAYPPALPPHTTYHRRSSAQAGVRVTVDKIEATPNETRVYARVNNGSDEDFAFHVFRTRLVANGRAVKSTTASDSYWGPATNLPPHLWTPGVLIFGPIPPDARVRLFVQGTSEDSDVGTITWGWTWK